MAGWQAYHMIIAIKFCLVRNYLSLILTILLLTVSARRDYICVEIVVTTVHLIFLLGENLAANRSSVQSSTLTTNLAGMAVDGNKQTCSWTKRWEL